MPKGLYIHVPFCKQKCNYCDFYSIPPDQQTLNDYFNAILQSAELYRGIDVDTVYYGGGTPTLSGADWLCKLLDGLSKIMTINNNSEITLEANPESVTLKELTILHNNGFNRISFGVQTMEDQTLAILGRRHTSKQACQAISNAIDAGFDNISADLMLALPSQNKDAALKSAADVAALPLKHISAYLLKIEPGTPFWNQKNNLNLLDEDEIADIYEECCNLFQQAGYLQYEISNFARASFESRHNLKYWHLEEYIGLGPAAHSFLNGQRFFYPRSVKDFIANPSQTVADGIGGTAEESIAMSLRLTSGLDFKTFNKLYNIDLYQKIKQKALQWQAAGLCGITNEKLCLTAKGFLISNRIIIELLEAIE